MKFRVARHTDKLKQIRLFYENLLGLDYLGGFEEHEGYNGIFLGPKDADWHLEFTDSAEAPNHHPDEEDLLVFYLDSKDFEQAKTAIEAAGNQAVKAKNDWWNRHGYTYLDPDGYGIVIVEKKYR